MEPIFAFDTVYTENTLKKANKAVFGKGIALAAHSVRRVQQFYSPYGE